MTLRAAQRLGSGTIRLPVVLVAFGMFQIVFPRLVNQAMGLPSRQRYSRFRIEALKCSIRLDHLIPDVRVSMTWTLS